MWTVLSECFSIFKLQWTSEPLLPTHARTTLLERCIFCHVSSENAFHVLWEDDNFIAFKDIRPAAKFHFQVIPKSHINSVKDLDKSDVTLVRTMSEIGHKLLDEFDVQPEMRRMGFHIPPYNSVNHIHLHVHGLPYKSFFRRIKYPIRNGEGGYHKGFSWFSEVTQTMKILEGGGRVGIWPC